MWTVHGGLKGTSVECNSPPEVLAVAREWSATRPGEAPWYVMAHENGSPETYLIIGVGADLVPVYFGDGETQHARSLGPAPSRPPAPDRAPFRAPQGWKYSGEDDPVYQQLAAYMKEGFAELMKESEGDLTFRFQGEWEHPDMSELVPADQALAALTEFVTTGRRPTNIVWEDI